MVSFFLSSMLGLRSFLLELNRRSFLSGFRSFLFEQFVFELARLIIVSFSAGLTQFAVGVVLSGLPLGLSELCLFGRW